MRPGASVGYPQRVSIDPGRSLPLPSRGLAHATALASQFLKFGVAGVVGFVFDTATVYALRGTIGIYGAGLAAYLVAATVTWAINRAWAFRGSSSDGQVGRQWVRFLIANLVGFALNRGTFAILVTFVPLCADQPILAVAAGALVGMFVNFILSRLFVFRITTAAEQPREQPALTR